MGITAAQLNVKLTAEGAAQTTREIRGVGDAVTQAGAAGANSARQSAQSWASLGAPVAAFGAASLLAFGGGVKAAMGFEQSMSLVAAATNATGPSLQALNDLALDIGKNTSFGATDAAQAINELALAGVSVENILGGAALAATDLAAAGEISLPASAAIMSASLNQFGLQAGAASGAVDAAGNSINNATRIADLFANAAAASSTGVEEIGESMKYVGTQASAMGYSVEDVSTALAAMAAAGVKGSQAGTGLNQALIAMAAPTDKAQTQMDALGISFTDLDGNMRPMPDILADLTSATSGMGDATRAAALDAIFGTQGGVAMNAMLISQTDAAYANGMGWDQLSDSVLNGSGAAAQAQIKMDNLAGSFEALKGSIETVAIVAFTPLLGAFRGVVDGINTVLGAILNLAQPFLAAGAALLGIVAVAGTLGGGLLLLLPKFVEIRTAMSSVGLLGPRAGAGLAATGAGGTTAATGMTAANTAGRGLRATLMGVLGPIGLVVVAGFALYEAYQHNFLGFADLVNGAFGKVKAVFSGVGDAIGTFVDGFKDKINALMAPIREVRTATDAFGESVQVAVNVGEGMGRLAATFQAVADTVRGIGGGDIGFFNGIADGIEWVGSAVQGVIGFFGSWQSAWERLTAPILTVKQTTDGFGNTIDVVVGKAAGMNKFLAIFVSLGEALRSIGGGKIAVFNKLADGIDAVAKRVDRIIRLFQVFRAFGADPLTAAIGALSAVFPKLGGVLSAVGNQLRAIGDVFRALGQTIMAVLDGDWSGALQGLRDAITGVWDFVKAQFAMWQAIGGLIVDAFNAIPWGVVGSVLVAGFARAWEGLKAGASNLWDWLTETLGEVDWGALAEGVRSALADVWSAIQSGLQLAWDAITNIDWGRFVPDLSWSDFVTAAGNIGEWITDKISDIPWLDIIGTVADTAAAIGGWVSGKLGQIPWGTVLGQVADIGAVIGGWLAGKILAIPWSRVLGTVADIGAVIGSWLAAKALSIPWSTVLGTVADIGATVGAWLATKALSIPWTTVLGTVADIGSVVGAWLLNKTLSIPWGTVLGTVADIGSVIGTWLATKVLSIPWATVLGTVVDIGATVATWLAGKALSIPWTTVLGTVADIAGTIATWLASKALSIPWATVLGMVADIGATIGGWLAGKALSIPWGTVLGTVGDIAATIGTWLASKALSIPWGTVLGSVADIGGVIGNWLATQAADIPWPDLSGFSWPSPAAIATAIAVAVAGFFTGDDSEPDGPTEGGATGDARTQPNGVVVGNDPRYGQYPQPDVTGAFGAKPWPKPIVPSTALVGGPDVNSVMRPQVDTGALTGAQTAAQSAQTMIAAIAQTMQTRTATAGMDVAKTFTGLPSLSLPPLTALKTGAETAFTGLKLAGTTATDLLKAGVAASFGSMGVQTPVVAQTMAGQVGAHFAGMQSGGVATTGALNSGVIGLFGGMQGGASGAASGMAGSVGGAFSGMKGQGVGEAGALNSGVGGHFGSMKGKGIGDANGLQGGVTGAFGSMKSGAVGHTNQMSGSVLGIIGGMRGSAGSQANGVGQAIGSGIASGIGAWTSNIAAAAANAVSAAISAAKNAALIKSPSRRMRDEVGIPLIRGAVVGINQTAGELASSMAATVSAGIAAASSAVMGIGTISDMLPKNGAGFYGGLTGESNHQGYLGAADTNKTVTTALGAFQVIADSLDAIRTSGEYGSDVTLHLPRLLYDAMSPLEEKLAEFTGRLGGDKAYALSELVYSAIKDLAVNDRDTKGLFARIPDQLEAGIAQVARALRSTFGSGSPLVQAVGRVATGVASTATAPSPATGTATDTTALTDANRTTLLLRSEAERLRGVLVGQYTASQVGSRRSGDAIDRMVTRIGDIARSLGGSMSAGFAVIGGRLATLPTPGTGGGTGTSPAVPAPTPVTTAPPPIVTVPPAVVTAPPAGGYTAAERDANRAARYGGDGPAVRGSTGSVQRAPRVVTQETHIHVGGISIPARDIREFNDVVRVIQGIPAAIGIVAGSGASSGRAARVS